jgi:outer membrane receptor protein involved in Fe transport
MSHAEEGSMNDATFSHGRSDQARVRRNWGSNSRVQQALLALSRDTCLDPANGCVPLDVFGAEGSITREMIDFINLDATVRSRVRQNVGSAALTGTLPAAWRSPLADLPIGVAVGMESRRVRAGTQSDAAIQVQGEVLGAGAPVPDREGRLQLDEVFAEALLPLVRRRSLVQALDLDLGVRHTRLQAGAQHRYETYKLGATWEPVGGLRLRAMGQRAIRAPNINELYAPQVTGRTSLAVDPCAGNAVNAAEANTPGTLSNLCRLTGVPVQQLGSLPQPSSGQINVLTGGNPALGTEQANTLTLGFIVQPAAVPDFVVTLDYYRIDLRHAITTPSSTDVLGECYGAAFNPQRAFNAACAKVGRGSLGTFNGADASGVQLVRDNLGRYLTDGFDASAAYAFGLPPGWGRLDLRWSGNFVRRLQLQATPASLQRDCLGHYSSACETPNGVSPVHKVKFTQRTTWMHGEWSVGTQWRHLGRLRAEPASTPATGWFEAYTSIGARDYVDLFGHWDVTRHVRVRWSVNNLFDRPPPLVGSSIGSTAFNNGDTYPQTYDAIGRYVTLGASLRF